MENSLKTSPWVLLDIAGKKYALSCERVLSLHQLGAVTPVPGAPPEVKGLVEFRGSSVPLVSGRIVLGVPEKEADLKAFEALMDARLNDHINWLATLEKCVTTSAEFTLATDPHKCAFGKWYDSYSTNGMSIMFTSVFARFDFPHKKIHAIAQRTKALIDNNERDKAIALINATRDKELKEMIKLFDAVKQAYRGSRREILVVFGTAEKKMSLLVDDIVATEPLNDFDEETIKNSFPGADYVLGTGKRKSGEVVLLLNEDHLLQKFRG